MTPAAFRAAIERLGYTQEAMAAELDINVRTIQRYCSGETPIPHSVTLALKYIQAQRSK